MIQTLRMLPPWFGMVYWVLIGAAVGSFLNVCIYRLPRGESIIHPRSRCPTCRTPIRWYHNIPIVSWMLLRGRCYDCGAPISPRYLFVEAWTAFTFGILFLQYGWNGQFLIAVLFSSLCIALLFIDWDHQILPDVITIPGMGLGLLLLPWNAWVKWWDGLLGLGVGIGFPLVLIWFYWLWRREEGMGLGDVKLLGMIGVFLGVRRLLMVIFFGAIAGLMGGVLIWIRSRRRESFARMALPFGSFLCLAAWLVMLWGDVILAWYDRWIVRILFERLFMHP